MKDAFFVAIILIVAFAITFLVAPWVGLLIVDYWEWVRSVYR